MSISFCDDDSQYPAFFGPRDLEIPKDEILDHLDWPPVDLACNGITYIRSRFLFADALFEKATKPPNTRARRVPSARLSVHLIRNCESCKNPSIQVSTLAANNAVKIRTAGFPVLQQRIPAPIRTLFNPGRFPGRATPQRRTE